MSAHPFAPQDFRAVRVRSSRSSRRKESFHPLAGFAFICFSVLLLGGLAWALVNRDMPGSSSDQPTGDVTAATSQPSTPPVSPSAADNGEPQQPRSFTGTPIPLSLAPHLKDWPDYESRWHEGLFESDLPVHGYNSIDDRVFLKLIELGIKPAKLCSDETFLRRIYIDAIGTLPTEQEAREFLDSLDPRKRSLLIDALLERPEFADYWTMKWCDLLRVKAEFPINLWPNAAQAYHRWIHEAIENELPYDQFVYQLLTSSGSNFRTPQVNFYRALQSKEPEAIAKVVALTFLCERAEHWPADRLEGMARFFSKVGYKPTGEWKEEIVFFDSRRGSDDGRPRPVMAVFPTGAKVEIAAEEDPRIVFADWLIDDKNPWFARAVANRIWCWLVGRGIVDPPDDVRRDNPATNLPLLNHLAEELIAADYDLKHLYRLIFNSTTYQLSCIPQTDDPLGGENFAFYHPRRLDAEVLIDAICQITGTTETYMSIIPEPFTFLPENQRAIALPDGSITSSFLEMFGRPPRDTGMESERNNRFTASQALHLLNSNHIRNKIKQGPGTRDLLGRALNSAQTAELLYLAILSRRPTEGEMHTASQLCQYSGGGRDLIWTLINSDEFLFRH